MVEPFGDFIQKIFTLKYEKIVSKPSLEEIELSSETLIYTVETETDDIKNQFNFYSYNNLYYVTDLNATNVYTISSADYDSLNELLNKIL